jgi:hypothetical protein
MNYSGILDFISNIVSQNIPYRSELYRYNDMVSYIIVSGEFATLSIHYHHKVYKSMRTLTEWNNIIISIRPDSENDITGLIHQLTGHIIEPLYVLL